MAARVGDGHPSSGGVAAAAPAERSAAFDSFMRLQCGQDGRTIDDKINDLKMQRIDASRDLAAARKQLNALRQQQILEVQKSCAAGVQRRHR